MDELHQWLAEAERGHGQAVGLVAEPGVGKSRLAWEFVRSPRTDGWEVLQAEAASYGGATGYLPVIGLLKKYFAIEAHEDTSEVQRKIRGKLLDLDQALEPVLPALFALLDVPVDDERWQWLEPRERRQRTLEAIKRLVLRESQVHPLVMLFEDLHWIDAETQAVSAVIQ